MALKKRKTYGIFLTVLLILGAVYGFGPRLPEREPDKKLPEIPVAIDEIAEYVRDREVRMPVKPGNEGVIQWGDSTGRPTEYVLLYLHGFTASRFEGEPITTDFVREFRVNAYFPRLAAHGLEDTEAMLEMTPARLYDSAKEALVIAHTLGQKVIVMGTSTGCTLALMLAADFPDLVDALILYSPNIKIRNPMAFLLSGPWGLQITRAVHGGKYAVSADAPESEDCKYWYCKYRLEAQVYLQQLLDMRMNRREFEKVHQPVFLGYYYKDEKHQDPTIDVRAALKMFDELGTPATLKRAVAFPEAGVHVIACGLSSKAIPAVRKQTFAFARQVLGL